MAGIEHLNDDQMLGYVLHTLDTDEQQAVTNHLASCEKCQAAMEAVRRETETLADVHTDIPIPEIPAPPVRIAVWREWLKIAAVLLVGFALGYAVKIQRPPEVVSVVPYAVNVSAPADTGLVASEAVDLRI